MRPSVGPDAAIHRPNKQSDPIDPPHLTPTTFFLTRDPDAHGTATSTPPAELDVSPVKTLKETLDEADRQLQYCSPRNRLSGATNINRRRSTMRPQVADDAGSDSSLQRLAVTTQAPSETFSPSIPTSQEPSLPSSPKSLSSRSFAKSDDDELTLDENASQAIVSSEDEEENKKHALSELQDSAPQLVMPSIKMPSRRPFTERGKQLGRFKLLVAGSQGSGRTSLIKSIVQLCEDIVHVDPILSTSKSAVPRREKTQRSASNMTEIYASTKPYPFWWSELDESRLLKRRKSVGDAVLERNICFVDTCHSGRPEKVIQYLEQQLVQSISVVHQAGAELAGLLSGRGGAQVDVVLFLLTKDTLRADCNAIQRINQICNVVPLISKADLLTPELITELKGTDLPNSPIPHLPFSKFNGKEPKAWAPYSVSSANGSDFENMEASLLMSPEYVQPLVPSELSLLIEQIFEPSTISYLRYTSAKKLVSWCANEPRLAQLSSPSVRSPPPSTLGSPVPTSLTTSGVLVPVISELSLNTSNSYALAKIADHTYREEHLAQIRLSKWASDLQLSLQRERERYECLAQNERALWLVQRMGEEIRDGQVISVQNQQSMVKSHDRADSLYSDLRYETHDPLGLLQWQRIVKTKGWAALQIAGSFGVFGGVALWLARTWGLTSSVHEWAQSWFMHLFGDFDTKH